MIRFNPNLKKQELLALMMVEYDYRMSYSVTGKTESRYFYKLKILDLRWGDDGKGGERILSFKNSLEGILNAHLNRKKILTVDFLDSSRIVLMMADQALILSNNSNKTLRTRKVDFNGPRSFNYILPHRGSYFFFNSLKMDQNGSDGENEDDSGGRKPRSYHVKFEAFKGILRSVEEGEESRMNNEMEVDSEGENQLHGGRLGPRQESLQGRTQGMEGWVELEEQTENNLRVGLMEP